MHFKVVTVPLCWLVIVVPSLDSHLPSTFLKQMYYFFLIRFFSQTNPLAYILSVCFPSLLLSPVPLLLLID